jgi:UDP-2,4-diacetamido-2,4,6-trideoxy-beta-L-altropyranose hydrolase
MAVSAQDVTDGCIALTEGVAPATHIEAAESGCDLLVADHYGLGAEFETACRQFAGRIMTIDDLPNRDHDCDLLLDQTFGRDPQDYDDHIPAHADRLCGSAYALLDARFRSAHLDRAAARHKGRLRILVSMGATDPDDATSVVLDGIARAGLDADIDVVLGRAAPHLDRVRRATAALPSKATVHAGTNDMAGLMSSADIAVGAAGVTAWERCCVGLPTIMVTLFGNQRDVARNLSDAGAALSLDREKFSATAISDALKALANDAGARNAMARRAGLIADGLGARRAVLAIDPERTTDGKPVRLRPAAMDDAETILEWQRHPETRRHFRNPEIPSQDEHVNWMRSKLENPDCLFNVVLHDGKPAGILRLDRLEGGAGANPDGIPAFEVSILIAPDAKRKGIAGAALAAAAWLVADVRLVAKAAPENSASVALFRSAGYRQISDSEFELPHAAASTVETAGIAAGRA